MKKLLLVFIIGLYSMVSFAHNPDASTTMLVEKENNLWVLQISASLTAFQQEIRTHFAETPYKSPEEFQKMVLAHVKKNLKISFNNGEDILLGDGIVNLGHETKVVFKVFGIPATIQSARVENTAFKDIHKSKGALFLFKEGFAKEQFVLNNTNDYTLALKASGNRFVEIGQNKAGFTITGFIIVAILLILLAFAFVIDLKPIKVNSTTHKGVKKL